MREIATHDLGLFFEPPRTDAEEEAATGETIEGSYFFG
jgi:hypothetical protein